MTLARFLLAAAVMALLVKLGPGFRRAHLHAPWRWGLLGGIYAIYFVLMFEGLKTASSVSTAAVFTLSPLLSAGFGWLLLRQLTTARMGACAGGRGGRGAVGDLPRRSGGPSAVRSGAGRGDLFRRLHRACGACLRP
jgi:hypothetical protein